jgi:hypothetical protein
MAVGVAPLKAGACDRRSGFDRIMIIFFFCAVGNLSCSVLVARSAVSFVMMPSALK